MKSEISPIEGLNKLKVNQGLLRDFISTWLFFIRHPDIACERLLGLKLTPHERIYIKAIFQGKSIDICWGRAMAKSFTSCVSFTLLGMLLLGYQLKFGVFSGSGLRGSRILFGDYFDKLITGGIKGQKLYYNFAQLLCSTFHGGVSYKHRGTYIEIVFGTNGGSIIRTSAVNEQTRSFRMTKLFIDERDTMDQSAVDTILRPFTFHDEDVHASEEDKQRKGEGILDNQFINAGTPKYVYRKWSGDVQRLMDQYEQGNIKDREHLFFHVNFIDAYKHNMKEKEIIKSLQDPDTPLEESKAECLALPIKESMDKYYPSIVVDTLLHSTEYKKTKHNDLKVIKSGIEIIQEDNSAVYSLGVDCAYGGGDELFMVLLKRPSNSDKIHLVNAWRFKTDKPDTYEIVSDLIKDLVFNKFTNIQAITVDSRGGGYQLKSELYKITKRYSTPIIETFEKPEKFGRKILRMFNASDVSNTKINGIVSSYMGRKHFIVPDYKILSTYDSYKAKAKIVQVILSQFKMIETEPTKNGLSFFVPSGKKKDGYSATLYAFDFFVERDSEVKEYKKKKKTVCGNYSW